MYTVSNRPSSIVAKTRIGIIQNVERLENLRDSKKPQEEIGESLNVPKPFFQPVNGKKNASRAQQEAITPQQEEVIKFIYDSWTSVCKEGEEGNDSNTSDSGSHKKVVYYKCQPNNELKDFTPFDLESWWGKRLFNNITKSVP